MTTTIDAEEYVIGALIRNPKLLQEVPELKPVHFFDIQYRIIYQALKKMQASEMNINVISLGSFLTGFSDNITRDEYGEIQAKIVETSQLRELEELNFDNELLVRNHARVIIEFYSERWIINRLARGAEQIENKTEPIDKVVLSIADSCNKFSIMQPKKNVDMSRDLEGSLNDLLTLLPVISTGLGTKTQLKLERSQINIIAALPGNCKTTLAVQMATDLTMQNKSVLFFSIEMPKTDIIAKMACNLARVSHQKMRENKYNEEELAQVKDQYEYMKNNFKTIKIFDSDAMSEVDMIIRTIKQYNPDIVFIDYLQLMISDEKNMRIELNNAVRKLKSYVKHTNTAIVLLSQVSRGVEQRDDKRARNSDLQESSRIEQTAAVVMFINYDFKSSYCQRLIDWDGHKFVYGKNILQISKTKSRYSNTFTTLLYIEPESGRIRSLTQGEWNEIIEFKNTMRGN